MSIARILIGVAAVAVVGYGAKKLWDVMSDEKKVVVTGAASFAMNVASTAADHSAAEAAEKRERAERAAAARLEQERLLREHELAEQRRQRKAARKQQRENLSNPTVSNMAEGNFGSPVEFEEVSDNVVSLSDRLRQNKGFKAL